MANYLNVSIKTREQFKDWILRKLGYPLVKVEVTEDMLDDAIDDSLTEFSEYFICERSYLALDLDTYDPVSGFTLPGNVLSVFSIEDSVNTTGNSSGNINQLFSVSNTMWNMGMWPDFTRGIGGGFITYELALEYVKLTRMMTGKGFTMSFNEKTQTLKLIPEPDKLNIKGFVCLGVNIIRPDEQLYGETWAKRMALANTKQVLGTIRGKYKGVTLMAGGSIDDSLKEEGLNEAEKLREELKAKYMLATFFVG